MKRIDRSSKGHYESETASRIATLGVHNLFEPYSNKLPLGSLYTARLRPKDLITRPPYRLSSHHRTGNHR
jgi:hypothetical protein